MTLSIRARLTLWYSAVVVVALATGAVAIAQVQARFARSQLDAELSRLEQTVTAVLHNEFGEGLDLVGAVKEASVEVVAAGRTIVVSDEQGTMLGAWGEPLPRDWRTASDVRVIDKRVTDGDHTFTVAVLAPLASLDREQTVLTQSLAIGILVAFGVAIVGGWLVGRHALEPAALDAQKQFMADASHQLRTPASIIRMTSQVILGKEDRSSQEYRESMTIVGEQSLRLSRLVDAMFLLSRADAGARQLRSEAIYFDELAAECVRGHGVIADARGVRLQFESDRDVAMTGDEDLLRQMLVCLLENAVRYTRQGTSVRLSLSKLAGTVLVRIEDEGRGIPAADRARVFERFVRLESGSDGAGLGLPMARWIAEAHGGSVTLESSGPAGSCFAVRLPLG